MEKRSVVVDPHEELKKFTDGYDRLDDAAKALGISQPFLSDMLKRHRLVSPKVLEHLGLERAVVKSK